MQLQTLYYFLKISQQNSQQECTKWAFESPIRYLFIIFKNFMYFQVNSGGMVVQERSGDKMRWYTIILLYFLALAWVGKGQCSDSYCTSCPSGSSVCQSCVISHHVKGGTCCYNSLSACTRCSNSFACDACQTSAHILTGSNCEPCYFWMPNCASCSSSTICNSCSGTGYVLNNNKCELCSATLTNCTACSSINTCTTCSNSISTISNGKCELCSVYLANCTSCSSNTTCTVCNSISTLVLNNGKCQDCSQHLANCTACTSITICTTCSSNMTILNASKCEICSQVIPFCSICSSVSICIQCFNISYVIHPVTFNCTLCNVLVPHCVLCFPNLTCSQCEVSISITLNTANLMCQLCSQIMPHCLTCSSNIICTQCERTYTIDPVNSSYCTFCAQKIPGCLECSSHRTCTKCSIGVVTIGGCTRIYGCIFVVQNPSGRPTCLRCNNTEYYPDPVNGSCVCRRGEQVGPYCTDMIGCRSIERDIYGQRCLACNLGGRFILQGRICVCMPKFYLSGVICKEVCGDGFVFRLPCDDGNFVNGDGCTADCLVQPGYFCVGTANSSSKCIYEGQVKLVLDSLEKVKDINTMQLAFSVVPTINNLERMDSSAALTLQCNQSCEVLKSQIVGSRIFMEVSYSRDLKGLSGMLSLSFDQKIISKSAVSCKFNFKDTTGSYMVFDPYPHPLKSSLSQFALGLGCTCLVLFFVASYAHKMIGVEAIHTFQLVFIILGFKVDYYPFAATFQTLGVTMGMLNSALSSEVIPSSHSIYYNLAYSPSIRLNLIFIAALIAFSLALYLISTIINSKMQKISATTKLVGLKVIIHKISQRFKEKFYNFLAFPLMVGFCLQIVLSLQINSQNTLQASSDSNLAKAFEAIGLLLITFATFWIYIKEWLPLCVSPQETSIKMSSNLSQKDCKVCYVPVFLTYVFLLAICISLRVMNIVEESELGCGVLVFIYLVFLICYRPYATPFHNLCITFNQLTVISALAWLLLPRILVIEKQLEQTLIFILFGLLSIVLFTCIIRVVVEIRSQKLKTEQFVMKKKKKLREKTFEDYNKALISEMSKQQSEGVNAYRMIAQRLRDQNKYQTNKTRIESKKEPKKHYHQKLDLTQSLKMRMIYNQDQKQSEN